MKIIGGIKWRAGYLSFAVTGARFLILDLMKIHFSAFSVKNICYLLLFLFFTINPTFSQPKNLYFEHLTTEEGLLQGYITSITQDKLGYLWIGTQDGLNRYDGYEFTEYKSDENDSSTISDNWVTSLALDKGNNLWVGTAGKGVTKLSLNGSENIRYPYNVSDGSGLNCEFVSKIIIGRDDVIRFATWGGGLNSYDQKNGEFYYQMRDQNLEHSLSDNRPSTLIQDSKGYIWLATYSSGIDRYDVKNGIVKNYRHDEGDSTSLNFNWVSSLCEDKDGYLWVGTYGGGLDRFDYNTEKFFHFNRSNYSQFGFKDSLVTQIFLDSNGSLWIGTDGGGVYLYDKLEDYFHNYSHDPLNPYSIGDNSIWSIYEDKVGNMWFGGFSKGLSKYDKRKNWFKLYKNIPNMNNSLKNNFIKSIVIDKENKLWVGHNEGITIIDRKDNSYNHLLINSGRSEKYQVRAISIKSKSEIWIGTWGDGLINYNSVSGETKQYLADKDMENSLSSDFIRDILLDSKDQLWICTTLGLNKYDHSKDNFFVLRHDAADTNSLTDDRLYVIIEDRKGDYWLGSANGLIRYSEETNTFKHFKNSPGDTTTISHNRIRSIYQDSRDILWVGTFGGGLNKFDYLTNTFITYDESNGLPNNVVYAIVEDDSAFLWLSTNNGLSRFDPFNETFYNYSTKNGLQGKEFNGGAVCKTGDGEIFFGGANGMNSFYMKDVTKTYESYPEVIITKFSILHQVITNHTHPDILQEDINFVSQLQLQYDQNFISFEFAALDYTSPSNNIYKFRLAGLEKEWTYVNASRRYANYTNLEPGQYVFEVIPTNNDLVWSKKGISLPIIILPPWWLTWWANTIYILIIISLIITGTILQKRKLRIRNEIKMKQLESEKLKEIFKMKSKFYDNISHEFRTPLTLIMGPIQRLYKREGDEEIKNLYMFILRNSQKLLKLIGELLYLSKLEAGRMKLNARENDIVSFSKAIFLSYKILAGRKKIKLSFNSNEELIWLYFDKEKMSQILTNLIMNAIKYTSDNGMIDFAIEEDKISKEVIIKIMDTGIGISKNELPRIYDRFFQASNHDQKISKGTGIGLSLTKELVNMHRGEINVESELNKGTTFTLNFKLGRSHLSENEIVFEKSKIQVLKLDDKYENQEKMVSKIDTPLILIVDDDSDIRNFVKGLLTDQYDCIEAKNGKEGFVKAVKLVPDLIISDIIMPLVDGLRLCQKLKSNVVTAHIPVILLTAKFSDEEKIKGLKYGADAFLTKPFSDAELLVRINNLIRQRKKLREKYLRESEITPLEVAVTSIDKKFIQTIIDLIESNISDPDFSVNNIIEEMSVSRAQLYRKFASILGEKPNEFIRKYRIKRAARLIEENFGNITQVAYEVGFNDISYFTKCFKLVFNQKPLEYKKKHISSKTI